MIDLLIPTRNRPHRLENLLDSILNTIFEKNNISIYFYVDCDDINTINHINILIDKYQFKEKLNIEFRIGPRIVLSCTWNQLWKMGTGDILMHAADDIQFESNHWDKIVHDKFNESKDKIILVYGRDDIQNENLATHSFTSRKASNILGYFVPPYFKTMYNDTWLNEIYKRNDRRIYISEIYTKHYHETVYPEYRDKTAMELHKHEKEADTIWNNTKNERDNDYNKLKNYIIQGS